MDDQRETSEWLKRGLVTNVTARVGFGRDTRRSWSDLRNAKPVDGRTSNVLQVTYDAYLLFYLREKTILHM